MTTPQFNIRLFLERGFNHFNRSFYESTTFSRIGEQLAALGTGVELPPSPVVLKFGPSDEEHIQEFVQGNFNLFVQYFSLLALCAATEQFYLIACMTIEFALRAQNNGGQISGTEINEIQNQLLVQSRRHTWYKFKEYGLALTYTPHFESLLSVRNCLAHRHGVVDRRDLRDSSELEATWFTYDLVLNDTIIESIPFDTKEGGTLGIKINAVKRTWRPSDRIKLTSKELFDMNFTIWHSVAESHKKTAEHIAGLLKKIEELPT